MGVHTYQNWGNGSNDTQYALQTELLDRAGAHVCLDMACDVRTMNKKTGQSLTFTRYDVPAVNTTPLTETINPAERAMVPEYVPGTLSSYGEVFALSREDLDLNPIDTLKATADNLIQLVTSTREKIRWNAAYGGTSVFYNSSAISSRATVNGVFTAGRLQRAVRALTSNKAQVFTGMERGGSRENTYPIEPAFYAFCSTDLQTDLRNQLPGFRTCNEYGSGSPKSEYEFGAWQNIRFFTNQEFGPVADIGASASGTNFISTSGTLIDVYPIVIVAKHALTSVRLTGDGPKGMGNIKPKILNEADKSDPLNRKALVTASWYDLVMRTNENWLTRVETACTNNPT